MWYLVALVMLLLAAMALYALYWGQQLKRSPKILLLHSLADKSLDVGGVSIERFEETLNLISALGFSPGTLAECAQDNNKVAITFDDGYDDLMLLQPLLRRKAVPITVFIPTAHIGKSNSWDNVLNRGRRRHLNAEQIRTLAGLGARFGSHGHTHRDLTTMSDAEQRSEFETSKEILSDLTGEPIIDLAFPFGRSNRNVRQVAAKLGLIHQYDSRPRTSKDALLGRAPITRLDNALTLRAKLKGGFLAGIEALKSYIISRFSHLTPIMRSRPPIA